MAKLSSKYEMVVIFSQKLTQEEVETLVEKIKGIISANGTVEAVDDWGKRKFAYEINFETEGYYQLFTFSCEPSVPAEIDRVLGITDGIVRSLIVCLDQ